MSDYVTECVEKTAPAGEAKPETRIEYEIVAEIHQGKVIRITKFSDELRGRNSGFRIEVRGFVFLSWNCPEVSSDNQIFLCGDAKDLDHYCLVMHDSLFLAFKEAVELINCPPHWSDRLLKIVHICDRGRDIMSNADTFDDWLAGAREDSDAQEWVEKLNNEEMEALLEAMMEKPQPKITPVRDPEDARVFPVTMTLN